MNWSVIGPAVFSLIGVALGTTGSLIGQYLVTRTSKAQADADRQAALRTERKDAIRAFLDAAQKVERVASTRHRTGQPPAEAGEHTNQMWFLQKCVDLVVSPRLGQATQDYAWHLNKAVYSGCPSGTDLWEYLDRYRSPFMNLARDDLGIAELRLEKTQGD